MSSHSPIPAPISTHNGPLCVSVETDPAPEDVDKLTNGLTSHATEVAVPFSGETVFVGLRNDGGALVGGLHGYCYKIHGAMAVKYLWVDDAYRGQGLGAHLMHLAEDEAIAHGCGLIHLDTFDFQARSFYEKLGYCLFGAIRYPKSGHERFYLSKSLTPKQTEEGEGPKPLREEINPSAP